MTIIRHEVVILGAGIAGLGAALKAREQGKKASIFEARQSAGGLLDNFEIQGFRFDRAVHLSFAVEEKVREIFDRTPYNTHPADSYCMEGTYRIKHPVQNNLFPLPASEKVDLITSFCNRPNVVAVENYHDWLLHQYGQAISDRYPVRYTKKYWDTNAENLSVAWVGNRMRRADLQEILYGAFTSETENTYYTKEMRYPKVGGYKAFIQPLIDESVIHYGYEVASINFSEKVVRFSNGVSIGYGTLISTLPLPVIAQLIVDCPSEVISAANNLKATSIDLVSVGLNKDVIKDLWFYMYDEDVLASRAYSPSVKSRDNAPIGCSSLQFEIYSRGTESRFTSAELVSNVRKTIKKYNIAEEEDIIFTDHRRLDYGNVIFDLGMEKQRAVVLDFLFENKIASCGRFGEWDYLWSNQSLLSGYNSL